MSITYQVERLHDFLDELKLLLPLHWREVAINHDTVPLDPDYDQYAALDAKGALHCLTVRKDGDLIGYHISFITPHLHYKSTLHALVDVYWLHPAYRKGMTGVRLFREVEKSLKARGVKKIITGTKLHLDMGRIFERLGWTETERQFTKVL